VDLVFDHECPHVDRARAVLRAALEATGVEAELREWVRDGAGTPAELRRFGSPTILVNGIDVVDDGASLAPLARCCRVYIDGGGLDGVPPLRSIIVALTTGRAGR
jgi:hypothetical protein